MLPRSEVGGGDDMGKYGRMVPTSSSLAGTSRDRDRDLSCGFVAEGDGAFDLSNGLLPGGGGGALTMHGDV